MNILHVDYLQVCLAINYKNIKKAQNIKAITKIIAECLSLQQGLSFIMMGKLHFVNIAYKDHSFLLKLSNRRCCIKKGQGFSLPNIQSPSGFCLSCWLLNIFIHYYEQLAHRGVAHTYLALQTVFQRIAEKSILVGTGGLSLQFMVLQ